MHRQVRVLRFIMEGAASWELATWQKAARNGKVLNLGIGQPAKSLLPSGLMKDAVDAVFSEGAGSLDHRIPLQYAADAGNFEFRTNLSEFLTNQYGYQVPVKSLFVSNGNSHGMSVAARLLSSPGDYMLMEDPSYLYAHQIFQDLGLTLTSAPQTPVVMDEEVTSTIDISHLDKMLTSSSPGKFKLLYVIPTGNNPTGRTMCDIDRSSLVKVCTKHNVTILSDDVYELLHWRPETDNVRPLRWHALQQGCSKTVVSLGTFSKILAPGLRLGWIEADEGIVANLCKHGVTISGGGANPFTDALITWGLESGRVNEFCEKLRKSLESRANILANNVNGSQKWVKAPKSGYFMWVNLPKTTNLDLFRKRCKELNVQVVNGESCSLDVDSKYFVRISFAFLEPEELIEAGRRLHTAIETST
eukprot:m.42595 g.42595  ORF g.42595 m.42595 type:complete len:417 (-) comp9894_c0_seq4:96-1346(-)